MRTADAFGELFGGHGVLVHLPTESALVEHLARLAFARQQQAWQLALGVSQLLQQVGTDGQAVAAGQLLDLAEIAEAGAHHHRLVAVGLVVAIDARDRLHAGILGAGVVAVLALLVPVVDAPDERRDEEHPGVGAGHRLGEGEQQGQVGLDALAFQNLGGADSFPGGGDLDQHRSRSDALFVVQLDQAVGAGEGGLAVERQARVDFGGNTSGNDSEDVLADCHGEAVASQSGVAAATRGSLSKVLGVARQGGGLEQQRRVGGGVHRLQAGNGIESRRCRRPPWCIA